MLQGKCLGISQKGHVLSISSTFSHFKGLHHFFRTKSLHQKPPDYLVLLHSRPYLAPYHASIITPFFWEKRRCSPARIQILTSYQRVLISGCCRTSQDPEKSFVLQKMTFSTIFQTFKKRWKIRGGGREGSSVINKRQPTPTQTHAHIRQSHQHIKTNATS